MGGRSVCRVASRCCAMRAARADCTLAPGPISNYWAIPPWDRVPPWSMSASTVGQKSRSIICAERKATHRCPGGSQGTVPDMETVQHPRQPNIQDKKGQHDGDHLSDAEGKGFSKNDRRYERFEALIQSQCTIATVDTTAALDKTRYQVTTHRTQADVYPSEPRTPHQ